MVEVRSETDISAAPEAVWRVLTDLRRFGEWNPFIREASGDLCVGGTVRVRVQTSLSIPPVFLVSPIFRATVLSCKPNRELRWLGHFVTPRFAEGEHWFLLEDAGEGRTRFAQREIFAGILPGLFAKALRRETLRGFQAMNEALKTRVQLVQHVGSWESLPPGCSSSRSAAASGAIVPGSRA